MGTHNNCRVEFSINGINLYENSWLIAYVASIIPLLCSDSLYKLPYKNGSLFIILRYPPTKNLSIKGLIYLKVSTILHLEPE